MSSNSHASLRIQPSYWVAALLATVAVVLTVRPLRFDSPVTAAVPVAASIIDTTPNRPTAMQPLYRIGAFTFHCNECHRSVPAPHAAGQEVTKHADVVMAHGMNTRCLNCHHPTNREVFVDDYGKEIPWDQPQLLCAKCHGPVYRDWQHGSHGRINGYWDRSRGAQVRLKCVECHDPHHPPFPPLASAPGPHTLRVEPHTREPHTGMRNPLRLTDNIRSAKEAAKEAAKSGEHK